MSLNDNTSKIVDILAKANTLEQVPEKWRQKLK